jgi:aminopeptidase N
MQVRRNPDVSLRHLKLHGEELNLARVLVNGQGTSFKLDGPLLVWRIYQKVMRVLN